MSLDHHTQGFPLLLDELVDTGSPLRKAIAEAHLCDEKTTVKNLLAQADHGLSQEAIEQRASRLIEQLRSKRQHAIGIDALMHEFSLSSEEGVALMCLAEALLRIPDRDTADQMIADKIAPANWQRHLGASSSAFVNAATWGLLITGRLTTPVSTHDLHTAVTRILGRGSAPMIRKSMDLAMRMLGKQFVSGRTIAEALQHAAKQEARGYRHSFDMLGEAAMTADDAARYYQSYIDAIHAIGKRSDGRGIKNGPGISVKLSALHPRYSRAQRARVMDELLPRLKTLFLLARRYAIGLNIDAEEADRLDLSLDMLEILAFDPDLDGYDGIGFVVQAYQKRCPAVVDFLIDLARRSHHRLMIRLVKGAYWDTEIKRAQVEGLPGYPVYTRKDYTDLCYLICARRLLTAADAVYPQFATHNALSLATIVEQARRLQVTDYEFQCLYGMGETLYDQIVGPQHLDIPCRIYAPVGSHETLLAYLVRRLLENGANTSFVNRIIDPAMPIASLLEDPVAHAAQLDGVAHPRIALPADLYGAARRNARGYDLSDEQTLHALSTMLSRFDRHQWHAASSVLSLSAATTPSSANHRPVQNPADHRDVVGHVQDAEEKEVELALTLTAASAQEWQATTPVHRADILVRAAELFEQHTGELMALTIREAGKSIANAVGELREAIDSLRYYSKQIRPQSTTSALGTVVCISPWNFPLAIFTGQIAAALAAGNSVLAKPAEQTALIATRAVQLLHAAGVPPQVLHCLPGAGAIVGAQLVSDARTDGVLFTGSTQVAQQINRTLLSRMMAERREIPFIAETGGQNAMIVDSSALCEQVVHDVIISAFDSAGQRCSALRVLCLQEEIADRTLTMLQGAMCELQIGRPDALGTDIGPVIDAEAQHKLSTYIAQKRAAGHVMMQTALPASPLHGTFVAPAIIEIDHPAALKEEIFGPVLHVLRYRHDSLPQLLDDLNANGYGLTLGIHSRIDSTINLVVERAHVGNLYVNRNIIGAVVGAQPFGGEGKSGTGPKAGGPLYLLRLQHKASSDFLTVLRLREETATVSVSAAVSTPASTLQAWALAHQQQKLHTLSRQYQENALHEKVLPLPGPTGEANSLRFVTKDSIACIACTQSGLLNQLAAVLANEAQTIILQSSKALLPDDLPETLHAHIHFVDSLADATPAIIMIEGTIPDTLQNDLSDLAMRDGPIVPLLFTDDQQAIPLWRLVNERVVCINTTAVGGNLDLITMV